MIPLVLLIPLVSMTAGALTFLLGEPRRTARNTVNLASALIKLALIGKLLAGVAEGQTFIFRLPLFMGFDFVLNADPFSLLFVTLSGLLWLVTTVYAIGYQDIAHSRNRCRFFGFFSLCVSATTGIALSGNLFTFLMWYELLTITTWPLVTHRGNPESIRAGRTYLLYTLGGGALLLIAIVWLKSIVGVADFVARGELAPHVAAHRLELTVIFVMLIAGFGVKAALFPLHGWLPKAMVAPAPVSALLHAVAVVKAGAFGIVRVLYDVYGSDTVTALGVRPWLVGLTSFSILYGSVLALRQDDLKRRLAYSTVSQLSYIGLGAAVLGPVATIGGVVHLAHQGIMKITMFFCAGNLAEELHLKKVSELDGCGRRMPWTMGAFTLAALGMIGVPPLAGFISKWYLSLGALEAEQPWVVGVLLASSALNAMYFLPILHRAWFREPATPFEASTRAGGRETAWMLLVPPVLTAILVVLCGVLANSPYSPLAWAQLIAKREYGL
jgi:formate hydrogenlyase subunit 3/multisubunit Na+/H+ antiporter MnhD subunit